MTEIKEADLEKLIQKIEDLEKRIARLELSDQVTQSHRNIEMLKNRTR